MTILRLRLRKSAVSAAYPFEMSYLVSAEVPMDTYAKRFGPCFSVPLTDTLRTALTAIQAEATVKDREKQRYNHFVAPKEYSRVVVPVELTGCGYITFLSGKVDRKINNRSVPPEEQFERLRDVLPAEDVLLHTAQNAVPVCTYCPQITSMLAGICTPGCHDCSNHLRVRFDPITYHPR